MQQSTSGEKLTAAISTFVAIAILSAAVTAQQARAPQGDLLATLESDLRFQLELAFRHDPEAHRGRLAEVEQAIAAWRASPRTPADEKLLVKWFRTAMTQSMPGVSAEMPAAPPFSVAAPSPPAAAPATPTATASTPVAVPPQQSPHRTPTPMVAQPSTPAPQIVATPAPRPIRTAPSPPVRPTPVASPTTAQSAPTQSAPTQVAAVPSFPTPSATENTPAPPEHSIARRVNPPRPAPTRRASTAPPLPPLPVSNDALPYEVAADAAATPATRVTTVSTPSVQINLRELNARIAGYHQELGEIEAATVVDGPLSTAQLERLVARLEAIAGQYQLITLYHGSLRETERRVVVEPRPLDEVIALVDRHVQAANEANDIFAEFDAGEATSTESPNEEPGLAERLAAVAAAVGVAVDN
jgi:hypothetical protein